MQARVDRRRAREQEARDRRAQNKKNRKNKTNRGDAAEDDDEYKAVGVTLYTHSRTHTHIHIRTDRPTKADTHSPHRSNFALSSSQMTYIYISLQARYPAGMLAAARCALRSLLGLHSGQKASNDDQ